MLRVLVTGGSGYLGQFVVAEFSKSESRVVYTFATNPLPVVAGHVVGIKVDLVTGEGLQAAFEQHGPFDTIINCAAVSQPGLCEKQPDTARAVNVPTKLVECLAKQQQDAGVQALLVHLSTDQVYDGTRAASSERDECAPVNTYGRSKLEAEQFIQAHWPHHVILRSSIIYGPQPPLAPVGRALFLQFMDDALREQRPTSFFEDEYRSPVYVEDILKVLVSLAKRQLESVPATAAERKLYCMGGPERLSRVDMARKVAGARGYQQDVILCVPAASIPRGVASPPDISMDSRLLAEELLQPAGLTSFSAALDIIFAGPAAQP